MVTFAVAGCGGSVDRTAPDATGAAVLGTVSSTTAVVATTTSTTTTSESNPVSSNAAADPLAAMSGPAVVSEPRDDWPLAQIGGTVLLTDGCLRLGSPESGSAALMIWPSGARWDDAADLVELPDGRKIPVGATVTGAGGSFPATGFDGTTSLGAAVRQCLAASLAGGTGEVVLINPVLVDDTNTSHTLPTTTTIRPESETTSATGCNRPLPEQLDEVGTAHTIVPADNSDALVVSFTVSPTPVCPTGTTTVQLTVENLTDTTATFDPLGGLMITAGSAAKWTVSSVPATPVPARASVNIDTTLTIPAALQPGPYRLFAYGYNGSTTVTITAPTP